MELRRFMDQWGYSIVAIIILLQRIKMKRKVCSWDKFLASKHGKLDPHDMISALPETVLHHMISFLPPSDKDQLCLLSRKWRRLNVQDQEALWLYDHRLNETEFLKILNDDFHSLKFLSLTRCPGMRHLKLVNFKLETLYLNYCGTLKNVQLNTPKLETLYFHGPRVRPCIIEFLNCKRLTVLHLVGVAMDTMMFTRCNESFPVLQLLTLCGCDMSGSIHISSNSIKNLSLVRFKNPVGLTIDALSLAVFSYNGSTILSFQNINAPSLATAKIELYPSRYQKRDQIWFTRLVKMLHCLKHVEQLEVYTNSEKGVIIPKQFRETVVPPLGEMACIEVNTKSRSTDIVDLADCMLWICPRLNRLLCSSTFWSFELQLRHGELSSGPPANSCGFCFSHPSRCWRHSVTQFALNHTCDKSKQKMRSYIRKNLKTVGRAATDLVSLQ